MMIKTNHKIKINNRNYYIFTEKNKQYIKYNGKPVEIYISKKNININKKKNVGGGADKEEVKYSFTYQLKDINNAIEKYEKIFIKRQEKILYLCLNFLNKIRSVENFLNNKFGKFSMSSDYDKSRYLTLINKEFYENLFKKYFITILQLINKDSVLTQQIELKQIAKYLHFFTYDNNEKDIKINKDFKEFEKLSIDDEIDEIFLKNNITKNLNNLNNLIVTFNIDKKNVLDVTSLKKNILSFKNRIESWSVISWQDILLNTFDEEVEYIQKKAINHKSTEKYLKAIENFISIESNEINKYDEKSMNKIKKNIEDALNEIKKLTDKSENETDISEFLIIIINNIKKLLINFININYSKNISSIQKLKDNSKKEIQEIIKNIEMYDTGINNNDIKIEKEPEKEIIAKKEQLYDSNIFNEEDKLRIIEQMKKDLNTQNIEFEDVNAVISDDKTYVTIRIKAKGVEGFRDPRQAEFNKITKQFVLNDKILQGEDLTEYAKNTNIREIVFKLLKSRQDELNKENPEFGAHPSGDPSGISPSGNSPPPHSPPPSGDPSVVTPSGIPVVPSSVPVVTPSLSLPSGIPVDPYGVPVAAPAAVTYTAAPVAVPDPAHAADLPLLSPQPPPLLSPQPPPRGLPLPPLLSPQPPPRGLPPLPPPRRLHQIPSPAAGRSQNQREWMGGTGGVKYNGKPKYNVCSYITDVEGNMIFFENYVNISENIKWASNKKNRLKFKNNYSIFVYGGDTQDKGEYDIRFVKLLLKFKEDYPERVFLIIGNRDANKLRIPSELSEKYNNLSLFLKKYDKYPYWISNNKRITLRNYLKNNNYELNTKNRLKYILETMGNKDGFEKRRRELSIILKKNINKINDDDVISSFMNSVLPTPKDVFLSNDNYILKYLMQGQLIYIFGNNIFVHGAINEKNIGKIPKYKKEIEDINVWAMKLNEWFQNELNKYIDNPKYGGISKKRKAQNIIDYSVKGENKDITIMYADNLKNGNGVHVKKIVINKLNKYGIKNIITGHKPHGDCPLVIRNKDLILISADTSYSNSKYLNNNNQEDNRGKAVCEVLLYLNGDIKVHGILADNSKYEYIINKNNNPNASNNYIGLQLKNKYWVKNFKNNKYLISFGKEYKLYEKWISLEELKKLLNN